ncbi:MAG: glycosyltransferase family 4 protein [Nitrososphaeria archaeon]
MGKLKILWYNWKDIKNPEAGGAEVFTYEVAKRWVKNGHTVTLFSSQYKNCKKEEFMDGIKIIRSGGKYTIYLKAKEYYQKYFRKEGYDIIIDEINTRPFFVQKFNLKGETVVALIHQLAKEYWFYETPFPINFIGYYFLEKRWLKNYENVSTITVSNSTKKDLINLGFKKVYVVGEGLNFSPLKDLQQKESYPVIVYVGRLKKAKRPDHAIKAFKIVKKIIPSAQLWIIGNGYLENKLKNIACEGVKFFSQLSNEERRNLISKSWVLVNPSIREGFGLNIIEANALGVPCIGYDVPGLRDSIINEETGFLVQSGNIEILAQKIVQLLTDNNLRIMLSKKALAYSKKFSWDDVAKKFMNILVGV